MKQANTSTISGRSSTSHAVITKVIALLIFSLAFSACASQFGLELVARREALLARQVQFRSELVRHEQLRNTPAAELSVDDLALRDSLSGREQQMYEEMQEISNELRAMHKDNSGLRAGLQMAAITALYAGTIAIGLALKDAFNGGFLY